MKLSKEMSIYLTLLIKHNEHRQAGLTKNQHVQHDSLTFSITGYYLDFIHLHQVGDLPELHIIQNKRPDVVAKPVRVQRSLHVGTGRSHITLHIHSDHHVTQSSRIALTLKLTRLRTRLASAVLMALSNCSRTCRANCGVIC